MHVAWRLYSFQIRRCKDQRASARVSKAVIIRWIISLAGTTLWLYGYVATSSPSS